MKLFGPYHKRSRTGSMQLSINAIVILVMAMAVLGLGLAMVRGLLGGGVSQLETAIDSVDLTEEASSGKPLAGTNAIKIKRNSPEPVAVSFYNTDTGACTDTTYMRISCTDNDMWDIMEDGAVVVNGGQQPVPVSIAIGSASKVGGIFETEKAAGTYGCTVDIFCSSTGVPANPAQDGTPIESETAFIEVTS